MGTKMLPILAESSVLDQFSKQKTKLNFSNKTDSEFILFLLETTLSMLSVVKQISPVIRAVEEVALVYDEVSGGSTPMSTRDSLVSQQETKESTNSELTHKDDEPIDIAGKCQILSTEFSAEMNDLIENLTNSKVQATTASKVSEKGDGTEDEDHAIKSNPKSACTARKNETVSSESGLDVVDLLQHDVVDLLQHDDKGNNQAECGVCGKTVGKGYLKEHLRLHLQNKWQCDYCHKTFSLRNYLAKHMKRFHGDKRFQCNLCQRSFASTLDLEKHMPIHKISNPFICDICHKGFAHYSSLKRHLIAHTGVKNYHCNKCDKYFMRKDSLNNHRVLSCSGKAADPTSSSQNSGLLSPPHRPDFNNLLNTVSFNSLENLEGLGNELLEVINRAVR